MYLPRSAFRGLASAVFLTGCLCCASHKLLAMEADVVTSPATAADPQTNMLGSISGTVTDSTGAVIPGASVVLTNSIAGLNERSITDGAGHYSFQNLPAHPYRITITGTGFVPLVQDVVLRAAPLIQNFPLQVAATTQTVTVQADNSNMVETDPSSHTDIDSQLIDRMPTPSSTSGLANLITNASPGVAADSNGMFHPLGEHSDTTFSIDGQNVSDQQSKTFSNPMSTSAIASVEVINGVIPAEYGDKASLVAVTTTKSGLGANGVHGSVSAGYGTFGSPTFGATVGNGNGIYGNFLAIDGERSGRFLDSPEVNPLHDIGNSEDAFDRIDWQPRQSDSLHLDLSAARSWFQQPNQFDQQALGQDQHQQNKSFNIGSMWTHIFNPETVANLNIYVRQDRIGYYPSHNLFSDTPATLAQTRRLTNAGIKYAVSWVHGIQSIKVGGNFYHTFLSEQFYTGLTDPTFNSPCLTAQGQPDPNTALTSTSQCAAVGDTPNTGTSTGQGGFEPGLLAFDLTRGGSLFTFKGRTDIKQEALYAQDNITAGQWTFLIGGRADNYNGLSSRSMLQPRLGVSYDIKKTATVLKLSYSKLFPTPYNENLILSSATGSGGLARNGTGAFGQQALKPGKRNQFNAGFEQAAGNYLVVSGEYFWKFTDRDFDFDVLFNTPLTFHIQWRKSKIDGFDIRVTMPQHHGLDAYAVLGHTRARFFGPEVGGLIFNSPLNTGAFRIDHDQAFEQTTHLQYQPLKNGPWTSFNWRLDSGAVAGAVPAYATALRFTPDQQQQIQLYCGNQIATLANPIRSCNSTQEGAKLLYIPAPGTFNADKNPARVALRNLFDGSVGWDNVLHRFKHSDRVKTNLSLTAANITNKTSLYNFLSTFSGTHFVSPRTVTGHLTFVF